MSVRFGPFQLCLRFPEVRIPGEGGTREDLGSNCCRVWHLWRACQGTCQGRRADGPILGELPRLLRSLSRAQRSGPHVSWARAPPTSGRSSRAPSPRGVLASFPQVPALWAAPTPPLTPRAVVRGEAPMTLSPKRGSDCPVLKTVRPVRPAAVCLVIATLCVCARVLGTPVGTF